MKIAMGNDHSAIELKNIIKEFAQQSAIRLFPTNRLLSTSTSCSDSTESMFH